MARIIGNLAKTERMDATVESIESADREDVILRRWTPVILRSILITASIALVVGLVMSATISPGYYVGRFHLVQHGRPYVPQDWAQLAVGAAAGDPHDFLTLSLVILTLVPVARVVFSFILFIKERDLVFVVATAYVLAGLIVGMLLGSIG
jgi:uncharacterized membrane protein